MKDFSPLAITNAAVGFPARLCVITRITDGTIFRLAESDAAITVGADTYAVVAGFQVSAVKHTSDGGMPSCEIVAVHGDGATFDTNDISDGLFDGATVQLYIVDRLNLSSKGLLFTGAIGDTTYSIENLVKFSVKGPGLSARILMTQKRSPMCRTDLFSTLCGVNKASYAVTTAVNVVADPFSFTVTGSLAQASGYFSQGTLVTADGRGLVIANWVQSTQTLTTYLPNHLADGTALTIYPGCDKTLGADGCARFSNQLNFQGEPHFLGTAAAAQQV